MKRVLCFLGLWLAVAWNCQAAGLILVHEQDFWSPPAVRPWPPHTPPILPPRQWPPPQPSWAPLEVSSTSADVKIKDQVATTTVDQDFYNPNAQRLEGTFLFPAPKGAQISKFTMEINGKQVEAELLGADKARGIYEEIVRKLKDPALLEYSGRDLFKVRIFPIEPHSHKKIVLSYVQILKADAGLVNYTLPLNTEKYSSQPVKSVSVKVELESKRAIKSIYSPSHKVEIKRHGEHSATIGFEASDLKPDADFQLIYAEEEGEFGLNLLTSKSDGEDGYFLLLASPGAEGKTKNVLPKDVVFVIDTSGSMAGAKLSQAKKALQFCVENLNDQDRFEIVRFSTEVEPLFDELSAATKDKRARAEKFVEDLHPLGGTAIDDALRKALSLAPSHEDDATRPFIVIFLTDGRPTIGNTDEDEIVKNATHNQKQSTRIFCFGIGTDVNTHLLDRITEETKAYSEYVLPEEDIEVKVSSFFTKIKEPVLANLKITFPDGIRVTKMYPSPLPDLFNGEQLVIAGRYSGHAKGKIAIEGKAGAERRHFNYNAQFPADSSDNEFIPRLWATRRVGYLLDEIRLHGENQELKDETTELARKYGIVTPYTAYLIVEEERQRGVAVNQQTFPMLDKDVAGRGEIGSFSARAKDDRSGGAAIAGSRSFAKLKNAESFDYAVSGANVDTLQAAPAAAAPMFRGGGGGGFGGMTVLGGVMDEKQKQNAGHEITNLSRYLNGKNFVQNSNQWIDVEVQKVSNAKNIRIRFDSPEYYELLNKQPKAQAWLALGQNVQFVLDGAVYEIYE